MAHLRQREGDKNHEELNVYRQWQNCPSRCKCFVEFVDLGSIAVAFLKIPAIDSARQAPAVNRNLWSVDQACISGIEGYQNMS